MVGRLVDDFFYLVLTFLSIIWIDFQIKKMKLCYLLVCLIFSVNVFSQIIDVEKLIQSENLYLEVEFYAGLAKIKSSDSHSNFFGMRSNTLSNQNEKKNFKNYLEMLEFFDKNGFETIQNLTNENGISNNFLLRRKSFLSKH